VSASERWETGLVARLIEYSDPASPDRAVMAHLRRGLGDAPDRTLARVGWMFAPIPDWALDAAILTAGLFAISKSSCPHSPGINFGQAFGTQRNDKGEPRHERRFIDLLDTGVDELPHKLRQAVTLLAAESVRLDWELLARQLPQWNHPDRWVQKKWARGFWNAPRPDETETSIPQPAVTTNH